MLKKISIKSNASAFSYYAGTMFAELFLLEDNLASVEWSISSRWIKYEEETEGLDHHWSKPRVSFLYVKSVLELRRALAKGLLILDAPDTGGLDNILKIILEQMQTKFRMSEDDCAKILNLLSHNKSRKRDLKAIGELFSRRSSRASVDYDHSSRKPSAHFDLPSRQVTTTLDHNQNLPPTVAEVRDETATLRRNASSEVFENQSDAPSATPATPTTAVTPHPKLQKRIMSFTKRTASSHRLGSIGDMGASLELQHMFNEDMKVTQIYLAEMPEVTELKLIMVRIPQGQYLPELFKANAKIYFIFYLFGPPSYFLENCDIGRTIGVLMTNRVFQQIALNCASKSPILLAIDDFLNESILLPQPEIDNQDLLDIDDHRNFVYRRKSQEGRRLSLSGQDVAKFNAEVYDKLATIKETVEPSKSVEGQEVANAVCDPFVRTGRPFGGVKNDFRQRLPFYLDDLVQSLNFQCVTSTLFIFFANFASAVAIGDVLAKNTGNLMGVTEILISHMICGVVWALFAGQPLCIMAAVGPFLVLETSLFKLCDSFDANFLATRFWIGLWSMVFMIILAMVESPFLMRYLTRFTEDIFTGLIAFIFLWEAGKFVVKEFLEHPLNSALFNCSDSGVVTLLLANSTSVNSSQRGSYHHMKKTIQKNQPNTALLELVLFSLTFIMAYKLKKFRAGVFCDRRIKSFLSDFAVPITIAVVTLIDWYAFRDTYTRHLAMKSEFNLTNPEIRDWFVNPFGEEEDPLPIWIIPASVLPAILVTILQYAEVEIVENLLAKKERCLVKPHGFHWDLVLCGVLTFVSPVLGLQWMCPAAVQSIAHVTSLSVMKRTAPGEAPQIDYVLEQRVTSFLVAVLHGAAAFSGSILSSIPSSALFGLFMYLGVMGLMNIQFWHRIVLFFVPNKYFPKTKYCLDVTTKRLHLFTFLQLLCFILLYSVNIFTATALAFPFVLVVIAAIRHFLFPKIFSRRELVALDDLPDIVEDESEDMKKK